jgi:basic membrane protein A
MVDPEVSLSTSVKKVWLFIVQEIESLDKGTWEPGFTEKGMAEGVTDYDVEGLDVEIPEDVIAKIDEAREKVASGELVLPTDLDQVDAWAAENQME